MKRTMEKSFDRIEGFISIVLVLLIMGLVWEALLIKDINEEFNDVQAAITEITEQTENSEPSDFEQFMQDYSTVNTNELLVIDELQLTEEMLLNRNGN